jgi:hypothetical protein
MPTAVELSGLGEISCSAGLEISPSPDKFVAASMFSQFSQKFHGGRIVTR